MVKRFSKRHEEIDQKTKELLEREPSKAGRNIKDIREHIAHKERARKIKDVGITKLQSIWNKQLSWREQFQLHRLDKQRPPDLPRITAEQAFDILRRASQHLNTKLREVAQQLVETGERPQTGLPSTQT